LTNFVEPPELVARMKALLRRCRIAVSRQVQIGEVTLDRGVEVRSKSRESSMSNFFGQKNKIP